MTLRIGGYMLVGIDLGTTNSAVAIWTDGAPRLIPNSIGDFLTPSAVSLLDNGDIVTGMAARERQSTHPGQTVTAFKRYMGTVQEAKLGKKSYRAEELSALVLASLKADVEAATGETVTGAIITVPAYFNDRQRKATRRAGQLAGLDVRRLVNEPTAAALAFGIQERADHEPFLVFDLGGGTFDVSIVEVFDGIVEVRASAGDNRLGGEDFNQLLVDFARRKLDVAALVKRDDALLVTERLRQAAELARRALSDTDATTMRVVLGGEQHEIVVTADEFEEIAKDLIARLRDPVLRSLRDSNIRADTLSDVVLVGGGTRMPIVRRAITRMFGRFPNSGVHPDHAVALGAAVQAGLLARDAALDEVRLTDVCPFTLGVDSSERDQHGHLHTGLFAPIIDRNTPIPTSRMDVFGTMADNQKQVEFGIYQGEARQVSGNVKLGQIRVPVPAKPAGHVRIECRFSYDSSGLLEVDVHVPETGLKRNLVIVDQEDDMDAGEIEKRRAALSKLKVHPRDEDANAALLARAQRLYESFTGERRDFVGRAVLMFEATLDKQDSRLVEQAREELTVALDELEGERYL
jgi:molecular chaperone HscC